MELMNFIQFVSMTQYLVGIFYCDELSRKSFNPLADSHNTLGQMQFFSFASSGPKFKGPTKIWCFDKIIIITTYRELYQIEIVRSSVVENSKKLK